jgi:hypothetical protein
MRNTVGERLTSWGRNVSAREVAVANADAACQRTSRSIDTQVALLVAYEKRALADHADLVDEYRDDLNELLERAESVVAAYPPPANRVTWDWSKGEGPPATAQERTGRRRRAGAAG